MFHLKNRMAGNFRSRPSRFLLHQISLFYPPDGEHGAEQVRPRRKRREQT